MCDYSDVDFIDNKVANWHVWKNKGFVCRKRQAEHWAVEGCFFISIQCVWCQYGMKLTLVHKPPITTNISSGEFIQSISMTFPLETVKLCSDTKHRCSPAGLLRASLGPGELAMSALRLGQDLPSW